MTERRVFWFSVVGMSGAIILCSIYANLSLLVKDPADYRDGNSFELLTDGKPLPLNFLEAAAAAGLSVQARVVELRVGYLLSGVGIGRSFWDGIFKVFHGVEVKLCWHNVDRKHLLRAAGIEMARRVCADRYALLRSALGPLLLVLPLVRVIRCLEAPSGCRYGEAEFFLHQSPLDLLRRTLFLLP